MIVAVAVAKCVNGVHWTHDFNSCHGGVHWMTRCEPTDVTTSFVVSSLRGYKIYILFKIHRSLTFESIHPSNQPSIHTLMLMPCPLRLLTPDHRLSDTQSWSHSASQSVDRSVLYVRKSSFHFHWVTRRNRGKFKTKPKVLHHSWRR